MGAEGNKIVATKWLLFSNTKVRDLLHALFPKRAAYCLPVGSTSWNETHCI